MRETVLRNNIYIYHHTDADGYASAAIIASMYCRLDADEYTGEKRIVLDDTCHLIPVDYNRPAEVPIDEIGVGNVIYFLDYTPQSEKELEAIDYLWNTYGTDVRVIVVDHHKTALKSLSKSEGLRNYLNEYGAILPTEEWGFAGCELAYITRELGERMLCGTVHLMEADNYAGDPGVLQKTCWGMDIWIAMTADNDIYSEKYPDSHIFAEGVYNEGCEKVYTSLDPELESPSFLSLMAGFDYAETFVLKDVIIMIKREILNKTNSLIMSGKSVRAVKERMHQKALYNAFEVTVSLNLSKETVDPENSMGLQYNEEGKIVANGKLLCAQGLGNSQNFLDKFEEYDACILYSFNGVTVKYSIYSKKSSDFPCNILAMMLGRQYGLSGGGHLHAAGCYTTELFFRTDEEYTFTDNIIHINTDRFHNGGDKRKYEVIFHTPVCVQDVNDFDGDVLNSIKIENNN